MESAGSARGAESTTRFSTAAPYNDNHAFRDYQMQLLLLDQKNKKRLAMSRQAQGSITVDRKDGTLPGPQVPPSRPNNLRHGLLTPSTTPPNAPNYAPFGEGMLANVPSFGPKPRGNPNNSPNRYVPSFGLQRSIQYSTSKLNSSCGTYQEWRQIPQKRQWPATNVSEWPYDVSSPALSPPADYNIKSPTWRSPSNESEMSMESMVSSDSNDTIDLGDPNPDAQWEESWSSYSLEPEFTHMAEYDFPIFPSDEGLLALDKPVGVYPGTSMLLPNKDLDLSALFDLDTLPRQARADINRGTNTMLFPVDQVETVTKKGAMPQIISNVPLGYEQIAYQSNSIADETATECRENQILVSTNPYFASEPKSDENIHITTEAPSLSCGNKPVNQKTSGQYHVYDRRETSSSCTMAVSECDTGSWSSDNDTDWEDDESDDEHRTTRAPIIIGGANIPTKHQLPNLLTKPVLSKLKEELVDRIMVEFWQIFNQGKEINIYEDTISQSINLHQCQEPDATPPDEQSETPTSKTSTKTDGKINSTRSIGGQNGKRKRQDHDDDDEIDETGERNPKKPKSLLSPPRNQDDTSKFACPYRKHDARKYCVRHWRSCALTPLETVARVKGHLYRHHRIFPCQRCKTLFNDQEEVNGHLKEYKACELLDITQQDGITTEVVEKLRSKKKAHRDQSEEERWKEIYQILFPGEMIPSPFFEEIQEDVIQSPDSRELSDYEEYCRRELPRVFRASLEEVVHNSTQPLEEQLRSQLMDLIRDAQDRVFSSYRVSPTTTAETPSVGVPNSSPQATSSSSSQGILTSPLISQPAISFSEHRSRARLPPYFQPPSPQNHLESGLDISDRNMTPSKTDRHDNSDSGYDSSSLTIPSTQPLTPSDSTINTSASSFQTLPPLDMNQETYVRAGNGVALRQAKLESNRGAITSSGNSPMISDLYLPQHNPDFDFDLDSLPLSDFDMDNFGNYSFSENLDGFL